MSSVSSVLTASEVGAKGSTAEFRRHFRPQSTSKSSNSNARRNRITIDTLNDLAQDPQRIPTFATSLKIRSKSAKFFSEEFVDSKKESKKQAWAPKPKQNLSSSSFQFQRHGRIDNLAELGDEERFLESKHRGKTEFGRVAIRL